MLIPEQILSTTHIFNIRHLAAFLCLGTLDSPLALHLEIILTTDITNKDHNNVKNEAPGRLCKGQLFIV